MLTWGCNYANFGVWNTNQRQLYIRDVANYMMNPTAQVELMWMVVPALLFIFIYINHAQDMVTNPCVHNMQFQS